MTQLRDVIYHRLMAQYPKGDRAQTMTHAVALARDYLAGRPGARLALGILMGRGGLKDVMI